MQEPRGFVRERKGQCEQAPLRVARHFVQEPRAPRPHVRELLGLWLVWRELAKAQTARKEGW